MNTLNQKIKDIYSVAEYLNKSGVLMEMTNLNDHEEKEAMLQHKELLKRICNKGKALERLLVRTAPSDKFNGTVFLYIEDETESLKKQLTDIIYFYDDLDPIADLF